MKRATSNVPGATRLESLALAESLGDSWTVALAQRELAWAYFVIDNEPEQAITLGDMAAAALLVTGDLRNHLLALLDAAMVCQMSGQAQRGTAYAQIALRLAQEWEDESAACEARITLGLLAYTDGDYARALPLLEENLAVATRLPNGKVIAWTNYRLGQILLDSGNPARAVSYFVESARLWSERNEVLAVAYCQSGLANCLFRQGNIRQAKAIYRTTLGIYRQFAARAAPRPGRSGIWPIQPLSKVTLTGSNPFCGPARPIFASATSQRGSPAAPQPAAARGHQRANPCASRSVAAYITARHPRLTLPLPAARICQTILSFARTVPIGDILVPHTLAEIRPGAYYDSVVLMQLQRRLADLPGIDDAGVVMCTTANKELLEQSGNALGLSARLTAPSADEGRSAGRF